MNKNRSVGFSLIEAIVAIAVLAIGIVGVLKIFPTGIQSSIASRTKTVAVNLAQAKLEDFSSRDYDEVLVGTIEPKTKVNANPGDPYYDYWRQVEVFLIDDSLNSSAVDVGLKKILVTVYWLQEGQEKNISIPTIMANK